MRLIFLFYRISQNHLECAVFGFSNINICVGQMFRALNDISPFFSVFPIPMEKLNFTENRHFSQIQDFCLRATRF